MVRQAANPLRRRNDLLPTNKRRRRDWSAGSRLANCSRARFGLHSHQYYKYRKAHESWQRDASRRAAIASVSNLPVDQTNNGVHDGFAWVTTGDIRVYSCYWSPNTTHPEFENYLRRVEASIRTSPVDVVVGGDFNAQHGYWSSPINDAKGDALADMAQTLDLTVFNHGDTPTREKDGRQSFIDLTLVSSRLYPRITTWNVL